MKDEKKVLKDEELKKVAGGFDPSDEQILSSVGFYPHDEHLVGTSNPGKDPKQTQGSEN